MQFKDTKQGCPIYILDRKAVTVTTGKVTNAPLPHFDPKCPSASKMVVDLNVEADGNTTTYVLDDTAEIGYVSNLVITANRECVTRELESLRTQSEEALKMTAYHRDALAKCETLLAEYSPEYKQRSQYTERLDGIEHRLDLLGQSITKIIEKIENQ